MEKEGWRSVVEVYAVTKKHLIRLEEIGTDLGTFIQPLKEHRDTLDHIMRAQARILAPQGTDDDRYVQDQFHAAYAHALRAFFDIADFTTIKIRYEITGILEPYTHEAIRAAIPNFYSEISPRLHNLSNEISELRNAKDIGMKHADLLVKYDLVLEELYKDHFAVVNAESALIDHSVRESAKEARERWFRILLALGIFFLGALFTLLVQFLWSGG